MSDVALDVEVGLLDKDCGGLELFALSLPGQGAISFDATVKSSLLTMSQLSDRQDRHEANGMPYLDAAQ